VPVLRYFHLVFAASILRSRIPLLINLVGSFLIDCSALKRVKLPKFDPKIRSFFPRGFAADYHILHIFTRNDKSAADGASRSETSTQCCVLLCLLESPCKMTVSATCSKIFPRKLSNKVRGGNASVFEQPTVVLFLFASRNYLL
jgi:hypothetical protein